MAPRFGLIGHGVVGSLFARLLRAHDVEVLVFDVSEARREKSFEETIRGSDYILAVTPTHACLDAARDAAALLRPGQVYCDMASTSPAVKRELAGIISGSGATFVEGAILGAVGASLNCPAILLGGSAAVSLSE